MRQVWITRHGPPEVLAVREAPLPSPGPGEVRIRVEVAGVNFADLRPVGPRARGGRWAAGVAPRIRNLTGREDFAGAVARDLVGCRRRAPVGRGQPRRRATNAR